MVGPFAAVRRKPGSTSCTRSMKRRTAGHRARAAGDATCASTSSESGPTGYSRSPRTWSGARLVASMRSDATAERRSAVSGAASSTCSKLSRTSSVGQPPQALRARLGKSMAVTSASPSASAIAGATNAGFRMVANGTNTTRVGPFAAIARASSTASRVLPEPPGPVRVTRRAAGSASQRRSVSMSASRPRRVVRITGSEVSLSSSTAAFCTGARALPRSASRIAPVRSSAADSARTVSTWGRRRSPRSRALTA